MIRRMLGAAEDLEAELDVVDGRKPGPSCRARSTVLTPGLPALVIPADGPIPVQNHGDKHARHHAHRRLPPGAPDAPP